MTPSIDRRRFLQLSGATAVGAALTERLGASIARAESIPADRRSGTIADVEHVVVLMQENRSFDHLFGTLRGVRGFGDPHPARLPSGKSVWHQSQAGKETLPFRPDHDDLGMAFIQDLPHGWPDAHAAFARGNYDGWIDAKGTTTMAHLERRDMPFHFALADAFTVCDGYHCSFMGSTDPNRYYMWTGWTGNDGTGGGPVLGNDEAGYSWTTYPERLQQAGVSWKIYQDVGDGLDADGGWGWIEDAYRGNYGDNSLLYFNSYRNARPGDPLYDKARTGTDAKAGDGLFDELRRDVSTGNLPQVSWICSPEAFTEHPNWPVNYGAWYTAQVLDALTADPEVWSRTVLLITYDENDGFFDHVVPPYPNSDQLPGASTVSTEHEIYAGPLGATGPYGLGQRVPMFVVSPWSTGGWVCSEVLDHTSIIRFLEQRFGVDEPNITPWRRSVCGDLTGALDFAKPHRAPRLPDTEDYRPTDDQRHPDYVPVPPAEPELPRQEPGGRRSRPLGYAFDVEAEHTDTGVLLLVRNSGRLGVHLQVRVVGAELPYSYTIGAGDELRATIPVPAGGELSLHGPNGFFRRYAGGADGITIGATTRHGSLLTVTGRAERPAVARIVDELTGRVRTMKLTADAGGIGIPVGHADGRYDVTVTVSGRADIVRQFAGRIERRQRNADS
ncbi:phosphocholine-specific phospholipase C [Microlunatus soli]|uniref:phospholipase C n=1 Tax=Microlunatus soli TaxID=630515 RepID=A0A1H1QNV0_9ACTN|nr:phospholipase C, phosphocholine-specific [Microlunatus soli]SDS25118.1 phospholipase C [Microlunatus soli]